MPEPIAAARAMRERACGPVGCLAAGWMRVGWGEPEKTAAEGAAAAADVARRARRRHCQLDVRAACGRPPEPKPRPVRRAASRRRLAALPPPRVRPAGGPAGSPSVQQPGSADLPPFLAHAPPGARRRTSRASRWSVIVQPRAHAAALARSRASTRGARRAATGTSSDDGACAGSVAVRRLARACARARPRRRRGRASTPRAAALQLNTGGRQRLGARRRGRRGPRAARRPTPRPRRRRPTCWPGDRPRAGRGAPAGRRAVPGGRSGRARGRALVRGHGAGARGARRRPSLWLVDGGQAREVARVPRAGDRRAAGLRLARARTGERWASWSTGSRTASGRRHDAVGRVGRPRDRRGRRAGAARPGGPVRSAGRALHGGRSGWQVDLPYPGPVTCMRAPRGSASLQSPLARMRLSRETGVRRAHAVGVDRRSTRRRSRRALVGRVARHGGALPQAKRARIDVALSSARTRYSLRCAAREPRRARGRATWAFAIFQGCTAVRELDRLAARGFSRCDRRGTRDCTRAPRPCGVRLPPRPLCAGTFFYASQMRRSVGGPQRYSVAAPYEADDAPRVGRRLSLRGRGDAPRPPHGDRRPLRRRPLEPGRGVRSLDGAHGARALRPAEHGGRAGAVAAGAAGRGPGPLHPGDRDVVDGGRDGRHGARLGAPSTCGTRPTTSR